jgi:hypothetical protein
MTVAPESNVALGWRLEQHCLLGVTFRSTALHSGHHFCNAKNAIQTKQVFKLFYILLYKTKMK